MMLYLSSAPQLQGGAKQRKPRSMSYKPNYATYSRAPQGWHDEPFEYVFSFQNSGEGPSTIAQLSLYNNPLEFGPDADFFMRGIAILVDVQPTTVEPVTTNVAYDLRLRDSFGRYLDNGYIPMGAYATSPPEGAVSGGTSPAMFYQNPGSPVATPWYPELYCPANSAMWADFQAEFAIGGVPWFYSFHLYFAGVKRFQNEQCEPSSATSKKQQSQVWFEGTATL